jgi:antitoxin (DNA-binding transcriptional repressor) of toxin-antitoxin stability system
MKVSAQYAQEHFADLLDAASSGEEVEIAVAGKPALRLALVAAKAAAPASAQPDSQAAWLTPERPRSEFFGSLKGKLALSEDWDSPETNKEIEELFENSEIFPGTLRG